MLEAGLELGSGGGRSALISVCSASSWSLVQGAGGLRQISLWSLTTIISISETGKQDFIHFLELPYQHTQFEWLKYNRDILSHSSGSWKSRLKVQQGWALLSAQASPSFL